MSEPLKMTADELLDVVRTMTAEQLVELRNLLGVVWMESPAPIAPGVYPLPSPAVPLAPNPAYPEYTGPIWRYDPHLKTDVKIVCTNNANGPFNA